MGTIKKSIELEHRWNDLFYEIRYRTYMLEEIVKAATDKIRGLQKEADEVKEKWMVALDEEAEVGK